MFQILTIMSTYMKFSLEKTIESFEIILNLFLFPRRRYFDNVKLSIKSILFYVFLVSFCRFYSLFLYLIFFPDFLIVFRPKHPLSLRVYVRNSHTSSLLFSFQSYLQMFVCLLLRKWKSILSLWQRCPRKEPSFRQE